MLYKRVEAVAATGAGVRGGAAARGGNLTKKYNKSSTTFDVNKKTRKATKTTTRENNSPKTIKGNKNKTQHFKIVRNGNNNTRKKAKL